MYDLPSICQSCIYWELAKPPYTCYQCETAYKKPKDNNTIFDKWIPITEKLPNLNEHVWITFKEDEELFVGDYVFEDFHGNMVFFEPDEGRMSIPLSWVTAWMPYAMPEPYRGE